MSASQRNKGNRAENEFLRLLGEELGESLKRNITQTRAGGADCLEVRGWAIEIKRQERLSRGAWWKQAVEQGKRAGAQPMLAYRRNREPWSVLIAYPGKPMTIQEAAGVIRDKWMRWP